MKKFFAYSLVALLLFAPGCKTTESSSSATVQEGFKVPDQYKKKSAKELRKEERRRQKVSKFFYNR